AQDYRVYSQGSLSAQVLGFVNEDGQGKYGVEQQFNKRLAGQPGLLKAITDVNGVPLAASRDNVQVNPKAGDNIVLTLDLALQRQVEQVLKDGLQKVGSKSGSVVVMDPNNGAIKAMANYPTYDPAKYFDVNDLSVFNNAAVADQVEPGSIMKMLTVAAGLNQGVITPSSTYHDSGSVTVDGSTIKNVHAIPSDPTSIQDVLKYSLNTGAIHVLKEMGGGQLNQKGRDTWHDYLVNHFQMGQRTGIEQPTEASGYVPNPDSGYGLNLQYANTSFGQGISTTMLQMSAALASVLNGGTYYQPHLVDQIVSPDGSTTQIKPKILHKSVVKPVVSSQIQQLMEYVFQQNHGVYESNLHPGFNIGGKTGTGQIPQNGGYRVGVYNGTFIGFVGGEKPQYVVAVLVNTPDLPGFETAGAQAAAPIFGKIADNLINNFGVDSVSSSSQ
ncbi:penicillin-binding protein 2, partial [Candidatus Saccharibacteria bacterium]|nr:penicillin-binding protein 2 [Candidatus Saccharibacteria bacterium]